MKLRMPYKCYNICNELPKITFTDVITALIPLTELPS